VRIGVEVSRFVQVQTPLHYSHRECVEVGWFCQQRENGPIVVCQDKRRPSAPASLHVLVLSCPLHRAPRILYQLHDNARGEPPPTAGARHERTLAAVACMPLFGQGPQEDSALGWDGLWAQRAHSMPCKAPSDMRRFRRFCPMPDRDHPYRCLLDAVEETIRRHNHFAIG